MAEWSKAAVSKTVNGFTRSGVRIPFSPPSVFQIVCPAWKRKPIQKISLMVFCSLFSV